jgi:hypothetical protein
MTITRDLPAAEYHAIKAMSAGMAWTMDSECPLKAWLESPWNPDHEAETATHFDIGTAAHLAVLEPHLFSERVVTHDFDSYAKKEAKAIRDAAYQFGKTPLKPAERDIVIGIKESIERHRAAARLFRNGDAEISLEWEWNGIPCKCRPDYLPESLKYVVDLKTANSVNPRAVSRALERDGWFVRAPWYLGGIKAVTGTMPEKYLFVVVEKDAPHMVEVFELDDRALVQGEQIIMRTLGLFRECMASGVWPTYSGSTGGIIKIGRPTWAEFQHADREAAAEFDN